MIKVVSLTSDIVGERKWFLKWRVIKRCNKEPSTLDQTTLNNGISHHGGCAIVQVLVLRYNQGANVKWVSVFKDGSRRPF